jgi:hypothetical protein
MTSATAATLAVVAGARIANSQAAPQRPTSWSLWRRSSATAKRLGDQVAGDLA